MADSITVDISGLSAIFTGLEQWSKEVQAEAQGKLEQAGQMMYDAGNDATPVLTGELKSNNKLTIEPGLATYSNDTPYAPPVITGHRAGSTYVPPNDFMTPGWDHARVWLEDELKGL